MPETNHTTECNTTWATLEKARDIYPAAEDAFRRVWDTQEWAHRECVKLRKERETVNAKTKHTAECETARIACEEARAASDRAEHIYEDTQVACWKARLASEDTQAAYREVWDT